MDHFDGISFKEHSKGNGTPRNQMERKNCYGLKLCDDLSIQDESVRNMNEVLEVLRVKGARFEN